jgi:hypothetical protein
LREPGCRYGNSSATGKGSSRRPRRLVSNLRQGYAPQSVGINRFRFSSTFSKPGFAAAGSLRLSLIAEPAAGHARLHLELIVETAARHMINASVPGSHITLDDAIRIGRYSCDCGREKIALRGGRHPIGAENYRLQSPMPGRQQKQSRRQGCLDRPLQQSRKVIGRVSDEGEGEPVEIWSAALRARPSPRRRLGEWSKRAASSEGYAFVRVRQQAPTERAVPCRCCLVSPGCRVRRASTLDCAAPPPPFCHEA